MNNNDFLTAPVALTTGEPAGIGPEICTRAVFETNRPVCLIGDRDLLEAQRKKFALPAWPSHVTFKHIPLHTPNVEGQLNPENAGYVLDVLTEAARGCMNGTYSALCTAPVQKSVINDAGIHFTGHTEYFAHLANVKKVVMMLVSSDEPDALRVALVTTHVAISQLAQCITRDNVSETLSILHHDLQVAFAIDEPRIAVTGLNPHAGEGGHIGREEVEVIEPEIKKVQALGWNVTGPHPADTIFSAAKLNQYDAVLCMYHDQGLPVLKHMSFGQGVNITLGLPYVRTSVDHGTALDIAGKGIANIGSLLTALRLAQTLAKNREQNA